MRLSPLAALLLPLTLACTACTRKTSDRDLVFLTPAQAVEKFHDKPGLFGKPVRGVWVDPRRPETYAKEHVAGAISLPLARMEAEAQIALRGYDLFIVYDTDFEDTIGKAASKRLMELGFDEVYTLEGGLKAWKRDGYEVDPPAPPEPTKPVVPAAKPAPATAPAPTAPAPPFTGRVRRPTSTSRMR